MSVLWGICGKDSSIENLEEGRIAIPVDSSQLVSSEELLMSQVVLFLITSGILVDPLNHDGDYLNRGEKSCLR